MRFRYTSHIPCRCLLPWILATFSMWHTSFTLHISDGHPRSLASTMNKVKHRKDYMTLTPNSYLWKKSRVTSDTRPLTLPNLSDWTTWSGEIGLRSRDNEAFQSELKELKRILRKTLATTASLSRTAVILPAKPSLSLLQSAIRRKKLQEIRKALRSRYKNEFKPPSGVERLVAPQETIRDVEELEFLNKQVRQLQKQRLPVFYPANVGIVGSHRGGSVLSEADPSSENSDKLVATAGLLHQHLLQNMYAPDTFSLSNVPEHEPPNSEPSKLQPPSLDLSNVEWTSDFEQYGLPGRAFDQVASSYSHGTAPRYQPSETWNSDSPLHSETFLQVPLKDFQYPNVNNGLHAPSKSMSRSFIDNKVDRDPGILQDKMAPSLWEKGQFVEENKDCHAISTKTCFVDQECSCHGFYMCSQGRCQLVGAGVKQPESGNRWHDGNTEPEADSEQTASDHVWHDEPISFAQTVDTDSSWSPVQIFLGD